MKRKWIRFGLFLLLPAVAAAAEAGPDGRGPAADPSSVYSPQAVWRNDFDRPDLLERDWKFDGSKFLVPRTRFYIRQEPSAADGHVLVIESDKATGAFLSAPAGIDLNDTPIMRWRWRITHPVLLAPGEEEPDDQALVVYFGDGTLLKQRCVGYRWELHTPIGTRKVFRHAAGMMTVTAITQRNNASPVGEWVIDERDVVADYEKAYGSKPDPYFIISVGANSQYSQSHTFAEVDFIEFVPRSAKQ